MVLQVEPALLQIEPMLLQIEPVLLQIEPVLLQIEPMLLQKKFPKLGEYTNISNFQYSIFQFSIKIERYLT